MLWAWSSDSFSTNYDFDHVEESLTLWSKLEVNNPVVSVKHNENKKATTGHFFPCIEDRQ